MTSVDTTPPAARLADRPWISPTTLGDLLDRQADARPDAEALVFPDHRATFAELSARSRTLARTLLAAGVGPGDRVGILLPASVDLMGVLFAAAKIGAVGVPINARFKSVELQQIVAASGMRVLVTAGDSPDAPSFLGLLGETFPDLAQQTAGQLALADGPELHHVLVLGDELGGPYSSEAVLADAAAAISDATLDLRQSCVRVRDTAVLVYTSGTTAAPKGAMLSHEAMTRLAAGIVERMEIGSEDRVWTAIPLFHGGGLTFALSCVTAGVPFVHPGFFDPTTTLPYLTQERVTIALAAFETIWMPVLNRPDFDSYDLSGIRIVMAVGVPERLREMARRLPGAIHVSCVAMTESSAFLTLNRLDDPAEKRETTGGHPMPGMECRVVDPETGRDQPAGTPGELLFRGANAFDGYFRAPELTAEVFDDEGWFHSGDLVVADEDGRLTFRSRLKDMLKVGGENVAAAEVEGYLLGHPAVDLVAVVAAPDSYYVEVPAAFIQLAPGVEATEQEIIDFCLGKIATYRVPRYVRFIDEWPMSGTKIKKYVLRQRIAEELEERGITEAPRLST